MKKSFYKGISFAFGVGIVIAISSLVAQSMTTFTSGDLITASSINQNFQIAAPSGFVGAFYLSSCPTGWVAADGSNSTPDLRARFIRGRDDMGGTNGAASRDPDGTRTIGTHVQDDAFQNHYHHISGTVMVGHQAASVMNTGLQTGSQYINVGAISDGSTSSSSTNTVTAPISDGSTTPRTATETRPANVALIYCMRQ